MISLFAFKALFQVDYLLQYTEEAFEVEDVFAYMKENGMYFKLIP